MLSRLGWREPAGERRYLSQDVSIIAKPPGDCAAVLLCYPNKNYGRAQTGQQSAAEDEMLLAVRESRPEFAS